MVRIYGKQFQLEARSTQSERRRQNTPVREGAVQHHKPSTVLARLKEETGEESSGWDKDEEEYPANKVEATDQEAQEAQPQGI